MLVLAGFALRFQTTAPGKLQEGLAYGIAAVLPLGPVVATLTKVHVVVCARAVCGWNSMANRSTSTTGQAKRGTLRTGAGARNLVFIGWFGSDYCPGRNTSGILGCLYKVNCPH